MTGHRRSVLIAMNIAALDGDEGVLEAVVNGAKTDDLAQRWSGYLARAGAAVQAAS